MNGSPTSLTGGTCRSKSSPLIGRPFANIGSGLCASLPPSNALSTSAHALNGPYTKVPSIHGVISFNCNRIKSFYLQAKIIAQNDMASKKVQAIAVNIKGGIDAKSWGTAKFHI